MVQSINTRALLTLASVVRRPSLFVPHVTLTNVSQLNYTALKENCGIRAVVFDKDNTLTSPYGMAIHPDASRGLAAAKSVFGPANVAIMSNSAGTLDDPDYADAIAIEKALGIAVIRHDDKKPGGLPEVLQHFNLQDPAELCMVGDRLLTDVVFGNLHGMLTVHTLPLCTGADNAQDNAVAKTIRTIENAGLYGNWFGGRMMLRKKIPHKFWLGDAECPLIEEMVEGVTVEVEIDESMENVGDTAAEVSVANDGTTEAVASKAEATDRLVSSGSGKDSR